MMRSTLGRRMAAIATTGLLTTLGVYVGTQTASATNCSSGLQPALNLAQVVVPASTAGGSVGYQETVTNTGTCGATDVEVDVTLPLGSTYAGFASVNRSWTCTDTRSTPDVIRCLLGSQLDQRSASSTTGNSGTAGVVVSATPAATSGGSKTQPPDVSEHAVLTDGAQTFTKLNTEVWGASVNPKTGGKVSIGAETQIPGETVDVTIPVGVGGTVGLLQNVTDPAASSDLGPSHLSVNLPTVSNGFNTITFTVKGAAAPPAPLYDENDSGPLPLLACKGKTASPPCLYSMKGYNLTSSNPYWLITIHDSAGTRYWP